MRHLLWDIDGTLLSTNGVGAQPFKESIERTLLKEIEFNRLEYAGRTDFEIANIHLSQIRNSNYEQDLKHVIDDYVKGLAVELLREPAKPFRNIEILLKKFLDNSEYRLSVVTGNCFDGALVKLESARLLNYFSKQNIFCSRNLSPRWTILEEALRKLGIDGENAVVIGDTLHDLNSARLCNVPAILLRNSKEIPIVEILDEDVYVLDAGWTVNDFMEILERVF